MRDYMMRQEIREIHKILYFLDYGKSFGGAANTLLQQAILMKKAGCSVKIFLSDYYGDKVESEYEEICSRSDIEILNATFQISSQPEDIDIICLDENYDVLKEKIQELDPDILHSIQINPIVELIGRELGVPHIMNIYPLLPDFFSVHYMDIFPHFHICDSWYWAKRWNQYLKTDYTCIRTTVNMDTDFGRLKELGNVIEYICVGSIYKGKNQLNVIKAFHAALNEGIIGKLSIWGYDTTSYAEECKKYIENNDLSEFIKIEGFSSNMEEVYKNSDVLICGSVRESYPNVISEAMSFGLIPISTPVAGVPEIISDGINGYLTDNYTPEALSRKIIELNNDIRKKKLEKIRKRVRETVLENHSTKVVTESLIQYYFHVLQNKNRKTNVLISDIRQVFSSWKSIYYKNYDYLSEPHKTAVKIWYLFHIREFIQLAVKDKLLFYIWGAGKYGKIVEEMVDVFFPEICISGFLDSKREGKFYTYDIYNPEDILQKDNIIILVAAINGQDEIIEKLEQNNFCFNRNYFIMSNRVW